MSEYSFPVDAKAIHFCNRIAHRMEVLFGISHREAVRRINRQFARARFVGAKHVFYHETIDNLANEIYYVEGSEWWTKREGLRPKPLDDDRDGP